MRSKKSYRIWNTGFLYLGGGLILFVLFRLFQKKKKGVIPEPSKTGTKIPFAPDKNQLTYNEIFNWLRQKESVTYTAKRDGVDRQGNPKFSIGMGHQIQQGEEYLFNTTITEDKVIELFKKDIDSVIKDVNSVVKVPLNKNQQLALISIRYNVGPGGFRSGLLLQRLNAGDYAGTAVLIPTFITTSDGGKFNLGLQNRRKSERDLFIKTV